MNPNASTAPQNDEIQNLLDSISDSGTGAVAPMETIETIAPNATPHDVDAALASLDEKPPVEVIEDLAAQPAAPAPTPATTDKKASTKKSTKKDDKAAAKAAAKAKREEEKKARDAKKAAEKAARDAAPKKERVFFGKRKVDRMKHEMTEAGFASVCVLTKSDAALTGEAATKRQKEVEGVINEMSDKVKNRATYLLLFVHRGQGKLNEVIRRAIGVLNRDGFIKTGDAGNLHQDLLKKPYEARSARAMGNNTVSMLKQLGVLIPGDADKKGHYVPNPESVILEKVNAAIATK
jgi:hypothetical protein